MFPQTTHASLLARVAAGTDSAAWHEFHERYGELIRSFARRQGIQPVDQDDVVQDVLLTLTRELPAFGYDPARGRFRGYLKTITLHVIYKRFRRKADQSPPEQLDAEITAAASAADVDELWEIEWRQYHVREAMKTIEVEFNADDRLAFQHYALGGKEVRDTAEALGLTVDQVYQAKSRITRRLCELIEGQVADEG